MKVIVLHGDNTIKTYERFQGFIKEARRRGWEVNRIDEKSPLSLPEQLTAKSLFGREAFFVVENPLKIDKADFVWLKSKSNDIPGTLVLYHAGYLPQYIIKSLPKIHKTEEHKLPKLIWKFLDSFYPGNIKPCLTLLHQVAKTEPVEFVFALLARNVRDLYWVSMDESSLSYPVWRISKLKRQAKRFKNEKLKEIIKELAEADIKAKTSKVDLKDSLDFLIITKLE